MRRVLLTSLVVLWAFFIKAQTKINQYEYWFDNNYAQRNQTDIIPINGFVLSTALTSGPLSTGLHLYNMRFRDDSMRYSAVVTQYFVKLPSSASSTRQIVLYEYWFDNNYASKTIQLTSQSSLQLNTNINASSLSPGLHGFNIRFKDDAGLWSSITSQYIVKLPASLNKQIISYEYWFDNNYAGKITQNITPQSQFELVPNLNTTSLSNGFHSYNIRFKDNAGLWSSTLNQFVIKQPVSSNKQITSYEYWFDNDYNKKITQSLTGQSVVQLDTVLTTTSLGKGLHTLKLRFKDDAGKLSSTISQFMYKTGLGFGSTDLITDYRYWFGSNTSSIMSEHLQFPVNPYLLVTKINTTSLDTGFHSISFQFKDSTGLWSLPTIDTFYQVGKPSLTSISPNSGGNTGEVTTKIFGNGFFSGTSVKLTKLGHADILVPDSLVLIEYGIRMKATFNLQGADTGFWNVVVTVPSDTVMTLINAFRVDSGTAPTTYSNLIGFSSIRLNRWTPLTIAYGNTGNINASGTNIYLAISDTAAKTDFDFKIIKPEKDSLYDYDTIPNYFLIDSLQGQPFKGKVYQFVLPNIPPNSTGAITFKTLVNNSQTLKIATWTNPPIYKSRLLDTEQVDCIYNTFNLAMDFTELAPPIDCFYSIFDNFYSPIIKYAITGQSDYELRDVGTGIVKSGTSCLLDFCPSCVPTWFRTFKKAADIATDVLSVANSCSKAYYKIRVDKLNMNVVTSFDPNEKLGPVGAGSNNYFNESVPYPYVIHFENVDSATAPAQTVLITDTLDQNVFNVNTLELGFIKVGDTVFQIPSKTKSLDDYFDLRPNNNIILKVKAGYNSSTGVLSWDFTALDPLTYEQVIDPSIGFLPPNVAAPEGEGSVFYTIRLKDSLAYNTPIANKACIYFDNNASLCTNKWINKVDNIKPESKVDSLIYPIKGTHFTVTWAGSDTGAGIKNYTVYYSINGGNYQVWIANTSNKSAEFTGMIDSVYRFYSIASDSAGNTETPPQTHDAITILKSDFVWKGTVSSDWRNGANWSGGLMPGIDDSVYIPANTPFNATVPPGITVSCKILNVLQGAVIIIGDNAHLNVSGH